MVNDGDFVGHVRHDAEIVRDHQNGHAQLGLHFANEFQDFGLDRHIQRRGRLVGDQKSRMANHRHGNHGALAKTARQFEGIGVQGTLGVGKLHQAQHFRGQLPRLRA